LPAGDGVLRAPFAVENRFKGWNATLSMRRDRATNPPDLPLSAPHWGSTLCDHVGTGRQSGAGGAEHVQQHQGIADDFEKHPLQSLAPAPVVDIVALETVLMEPLEEPRAGLDKLAA
jgi:hypothetical protein